VQKDVFWLDVAVNHVQFVEIVHCLSDFLHVLLCLFFGQAVGGAFVHQFEQIASEAGLEEEIDVVFIEEEGVEVHDVGMVHAALNFNLPDKLRQVGLVQEGSIDNLQTEDEAACLVPMWGMHYWTR
jgi:hypothetical protein